MPELIAKPALEKKPLTLAETTLETLDLGPITSVALYPGQEKTAAKALKPLGLSFPAPNRFSAKSGAWMVWTGREQAFLIGAEPPALAEAAALTDQSGGWAAFRLHGAKVAEVLARLVPLDLRDKAFPPGSAARAPLGHMSAVIWRAEDGGILLMVFRSMARTAWHELETALRTVAARG